MPLSFTCPQCGKKYERIRDKYLGKKMQCSCGLVVRLGGKQSKPKAPPAHEPMELPEASIESLPASAVAEPLLIPKSQAVPATSAAPKPAPKRLNPNAFEDLDLAELDSEPKKKATPEKRETVPPSDSDSFPWDAKPDEVTSQAAPQDLTDDLEIVEAMPVAEPTLAVPVNAKQEAEIQGLSVVEAEPVSVPVATPDLDDLQPFELPGTAPSEIIIDDDDDDVVELKLYQEGEEG